MNQVYPIPTELANRTARLAELEQLCRLKIAEVLQAYLESEADELIGRRRYERTQDTVPVYRNGHDPERTISTPAGGIPIRRPRLRGMTFESEVLPKHARRLPSLDATFHKLWLEGLAQRDFEPALRALLGTDAPLSASTIGRVNAQFRSEFDAWKMRRLEHEHYAYIWADGVHLGAGPGDERRVLLVVIGADLQGKKHLVGLDEAMAESEESWREVLHDLKVRGLRSPQLAIADGAGGFWNALAAIYPHAKQQRCWLHKMRNVLDKVPEKLKPEMHRAMREIWTSASRAEAVSKVESLARSLAKDYPKAAACLRDDVDRMLTYFSFPKESWKSLRTTNPIESTFAWVRLRTNAMKRLRSGSSALYLVFKLIERQAISWRRICGHKTIALAQENVA